MWTKSTCFVRFDRHQDELFEEIINLFEDNLQKTIIARTFVVSNIALQVMKTLGVEKIKHGGSLEDLANGINAFEKKIRRKSFIFIMEKLLSQM